MTAFIFSIEQLRAAPPEVQRWAAGELARALAAIGGHRPEAAQIGSSRQLRPQPQALAACTIPEAARVLELIGNDPVVLRVFFELGRETTMHTGLPGLQAMRVGDLLHHTGLAGIESLFTELSAIDGAFRRVRGDGGAGIGGGLFGFDDAGHLYLHEMTQVSIRRVWEVHLGPPADELDDAGEHPRVWEELVQARAAAAAEGEAAEMAAPRFEGFVPSSPLSHPRRPIDGDTQRSG